MQKYNSKLKIIYLGVPDFAKIILEKLCEHGLKPGLIITAPDKPVGRRQIITPPPVKLSAEKYNIKIIQPTEIRSAKSEIQNLKPDLGIVAAYGQLIPAELLTIPKYGFVNVHPSLLPKYRGPSPIQYAILNGDKETGVTIMQIDEKFDHGKIISSIKCPVSSMETYETLSKKLAESGVKLLIETIAKLEKGMVKRIPQDDSRATLTKPLTREMGQIDWKKPVEAIERQIRALNPWPGTFTDYEGKRLKIRKAELKNGRLMIKEVQLEGKKPMSFEEFLKGHPSFDILKLKSEARNPKSEKK